MKLNKFLTLLKDIFSMGGISLTRVLCAFIILDVFIVWDIDCIKSVHMQDIKTGVMTIVLAALGVKGWQAYSDGQLLKKKKSKEGGK